MVALITSRDNETLKLVRKLLGQRKHRDETGLFAAEGEDLVDAAAAAGIQPVHLLVAGETVDDSLLPGVSTLPHPARRIGVYRRDDLPSEVRDTCLGLWRLADPGNVGALVRTADAFGACIALSGGCADPLSPKALRASVGAIFRVPLVAWEDVPGRRVALVAHGGEPLIDIDLTPPLTFLLGAERAGLPEELVTTSHKATIALRGDAESLNVAAAGAIALYEASRQGGELMQPWRTRSRRTLLDRRPWLAVESHVVELPDGSLIEDWPWLIGREFVNVVAVTEDGSFLVFRQVKYAVEGTSLAPVGGYLDDEEEPESASRRELLEETGYEAAVWTPLGSFVVDGNRGAGVGHLYLARGARKVAEPHADDLEEQELLELSRDDVEAALLAGQFKVMSWATAVALALLSLGSDPAGV